MIFWPLQASLPMTDDQLLRYSRHILLDEVGIEGQAVSYTHLTLPTNREV